MGARKDRRDYKEQPSEDDDYHMVLAMIMLLA